MHTACKLPSQAAGGSVAIKIIMLSIHPNHCRLKSIARLHSGDSEAMNLKN